MTTSQSDEPILNSQRLLHLNYDTCQKHHSHIYSHLIIQESIHEAYYVNPINTLLFIHFLRFKNKDYRLTWIICIESKDQNAYHGSIYASIYQFFDDDLLTLSQGEYNPDGDLEKYNHFVEIVLNMISNYFEPNIL